VKKTLTVTLKDGAAVINTDDILWAESWISARYSSIFRTVPLRRYRPWKATEEFRYPSKNSLICSISAVEILIAEGLTPEATSKPDTAMHGYGISRVRDIARQHGGEAKITAVNGTFLIEILMNM